MVRRGDRHGEALIWCRTCSGYARQRMGPKLMNCCKPEKMETKESGKMLKQFAILEEGILAKNASGRTIEVQKRSAPSGGLG